MDAGVKIGRQDFSPIYLGILASYYPLVRAAGRGNNMVQYLLRDVAEGWKNQNASRAQQGVAKAERSDPSSSTFLSHSTKDTDLLPVVVHILENHGARVYIDKKDPTLPPYTNRSTAEILRDRIKQSPKFVLLASENSKDSRWVPWELGLGDGYKRPSNVAIFSAVESPARAAWTSAEYLGVYDQIVFGPHVEYTEKIWMVWNREKNTGTELADWLGR